MDLARGFGWLVIGAASVTVAWPAPARACSCDFSGPGRFYFGVDGKLPRDAVGIPWFGPNTLRPSEYETRPITDRVVLLRHVDGREVAAPFTIVPSGRIDLIVPKGGLRPGDTFTVTVREYGWDAPHRRYRGPVRRGKAKPREPPPALPYELTTTVTVTADEPALQGATIELSRRNQRMVQHARFLPASCWGEREADTIDLTTVLPPALEPYRDYLLYETRVDDTPRDDQRSNCAPRMPGRSWMMEPGADLLFSECAGEVDGTLASLRGNYPRVAREGLRPRGYGVTVTISTPDGAHSFTTPPLRFEIGCATSPPPPDPEPPATPVPSASSPEVPPPEVPPVAPPGSPGPPPTSAPRGCTLAAPAWTWLLAPLLLLRRRGRSS